MTSGAWSDRYLLAAEDRLHFIEDGLSHQRLEFAGNVNVPLGNDNAPGIGRLSQRLGERLRTEQLALLRAQSKLSDLPQHLFSGVQSRSEFFKRLGNKWSRVLVRDDCLCA